jgi:hypothetical protein
LDDRDATGYLQDWGQLIVLPPKRYKPRKQRHPNFKFVKIAITIIRCVDVKKSAGLFVPYDGYRGAYSTPFLRNSTLVCVMGLQPA